MRFARRYLPLHPADQSPELFDIPADNGSRYYRVVRLGQVVEPGSPLRAFMVGIPGRKVGAVLDQCEVDDGVLALVSVDRDATDADAEVFVEVKDPPAVPTAPRGQHTNIFDFTNCAGATLRR